MNAIGLAAANHDLSIDGFLERTRTIVHGTTATTNALIEGNVDKVGLITTRGFRDILVAREGGKERPFRWDLDYPPSFVPRYLIHQVSERVNSEGEVEVPVNREDVERAIRTLTMQKVKGIAVCFLWSIVNPTHELEVGRIIEKNWPEVKYDLSHQVNPIIREYRRFIATAINSSLHGVINAYVNELENLLRASGFSGNLLFMTSTGGVTNSREILARPIVTIGSGPSMLPISSLQIGRLERGAEDVIGLDMGGTSFDIAFVRKGQNVLTREAGMKPSEEGGDKLGIATVDVESVGAGGGSIAWVDQGGHLHVGPSSAGANPGPACYELGGTEPTVTDANLTLGYLNKDYFLGGRKKLSPEKSKEAMRKISSKLGVDELEAASRIFTTVNYDMILSLRDLSTKRALDVRDTFVVGGGGAFGLHAAVVAKELGMREVLVPKVAAVLSAFGGLLSDVKKEFTGVHYTRSDSFDFEGVNAVLQKLEEESSKFLQNMNVAPENRLILPYVEDRYPFQVYELEVPLPASRTSPENLDSLARNFHDTHFSYYAIKDQGSRVEYVSWRMVAVGKVPKFKGIELPFAGERPPTIKGKRKAFFREEGLVWTNTYDGSQLRFGNKLLGPAIIEETSTTILIPPECTATVTKFGNYVLTVSQ
jgi:N-methylhydantoinase A